jgi:hypothetical protein
MAAYYNEIDPYAAQWLPTITLYLWWASDTPDYWFSLWAPVGVPRRTWFEPIEDEI